MTVYVTPPKEAQRYAREALQIRAALPKSYQAMTETGLREARKTAKGTPRDARMIVNWFARHAANIDKAIQEGHTPATSKALQASWGWGHIPMLDAARKALRDAGQ